MSRDLNKICVTFPSSIIDMIIVCFLYSDNSLFAGLIFRLYSQCQNVSFLQCSDEKSKFQVGKNFEEKKHRFVE